MDSLKQLFQFIMKNERTIVYGNLGRKYHILYEYIIKELPTFEIIMESKYYTLFSKDHIHVNVKTSTKCDLYIYIEPEPDALIIHPEYASKVVVFTSHLLSRFLTHSYWAPATYYHLNNPIKTEINKTKVLKSLQQPSRYLDHLDKISTYRLESQNVKTVSVNTGVNASMNNIILIPGNTYPIFTTKTVVIADLTQVTSPGAMFLYLLDIIDFIKDNVDMLEYWFICFPNHGIHQYNSIVTTNLDKLFCINFKYSNISMSNVISIYPFLKIGTKNQSEPCVKRKMCHLNYVAPVNDFDAYNAAILFNLEPLTFNLYLVSD